MITVRAQVKDSACVCCSNCRTIQRHLRITLRKKSNTASHLLLSRNAQLRPIQQIRRKGFPRKHREAETRRLANGCDSSANTTRQGQGLGTLLTGQFQKRQLVDRQLDVMIVQQCLATSTARGLYKPTPR